MKHIIEEIKNLTFEGSKTEYARAISDVLEILNADNIANRYVIFESWTVADLRERIAYNGGGYPTLKKITDEQFYDLLDYLSGKDKTFHDQDGTNLDMLEEFAANYFEGDMGHE